MDRSKAQGRTTTTTVRLEEKMEHGGSLLTTDYPLFLDSSTTFEVVGSPPLSGTWEIRKNFCNVPKKCSDGHKSSQRIRQSKVNI